MRGRVMRRTGSVVIAGLKELDSFFRHDVDQPMLLREASGPRAGNQVLQRLRLPDSREWIAEDCFDEIERTKRDLPFVSNPEAKVFPKFGTRRRARAISRRLRLPDDGDHGGTRQFHMG